MLREPNIKGELYGKDFIGTGGLLSDRLSDGNDQPRGADCKIKKQKHPQKRYGKFGRIQRHAAFWKGLWLDRKSVV